MELVQGHETRLWDRLATTASQDFLLKYFKSECVLVLGGGVVVAIASLKFVLRFPVLLFKCK